MLSSISNSNRVGPGLSRRRSALMWLVTVALTLVLVLLMGSALIRHVYERWPENRIYRQAHASMGPRTEVVALGNSLVRSAVRPSQMPQSTVVLAPNGADYRALLLVLEANLPRMPSLRWVLIQLDNLCLHYDRVGPYADYGQLYDLGVQVSSLSHGRKERVLRMLKDNPIFYPILYLPRVTPSLILAEQRRRPCVTEPGFMTYTEAMAPDILAERNLAADQNLLDSSARSENLEALHQIVDLLEAHDIRILWLRLPRNRLYAEALSNRWWEREGTLVSEMRQRQGENFRMLDLGGDAAFDYGLFCDSRHLNHEGANLFSRKLGAWLTEEHVH